MSGPEFIDNLDGNTMAAALLRLLEVDAGGKDMSTGPHDAPGAGKGTPRTGLGTVDELRIATAYFSPSGFTQVVHAIAPIPSVKLLLGSDPIADGELWRRKLGEDDDKFARRSVRESLQRQDKNLREERDHIPFSRPGADAMRRLVKALQAGNMQVRRYEQSFLHAKAYIVTPANDDFYVGSRGVIAGSSNMTASGLSRNLELNLGKYDLPTVKKARSWFDQLWDEAVDFDLASLFEDVFEIRTPFQIFLRVLWELYGDDIEADPEASDRLTLTIFQKHGAARARRIIDKIGGVIVADEVGLGKTYIAGEILSGYQQRRQRALLICPAALRDTTWDAFIHKYKIFLESVSFEELGLDNQLHDEKRRPRADRENLKQKIDQYQLVIIDEAHNYRNPDSPYRAGALRAFLSGPRKDVLMLTATPVNNSLWDLYHLTRFFLKQDACLADKGIVSIHDRFRHAMRINPTNLSPDVLYPIVDATTVKRTRHFIKKHYRDEQIEAPDGTMQTIVFPEPEAISVRYSLDSLKQGLFDLIERYLDPDDKDCIQFARYKTRTYLKAPDPDAARVADAVTGLLLSGLLKRFESSTGAFRISIERLIKQHKEFLRALQKGFVIFSTFFDDELDTSSVDDDTFEEILADSEHRADAADYDAAKLQEEVAADLEKLEEILGLIANIKQGDDPKIQALISELEKIHRQARDGASEKEERDNRKVLVFTFFADSARWIHEHLAKAVRSNPKLKGYKGRTAIVAGKSHADAEEDKATAAASFAPDTAGRSGSKKQDKIDILVSTDVLAEGFNLQQARHIINYDMPWNPMRLVQRHGRIDRIGSPHPRVFMRTIFPDDRLDRLLNLEERIASKIAMAAASVGVVSPIAEVSAKNRDFTETRAEIQKLLEEDASLYRHGGTTAITQSGEEYRQILRKELSRCKDEIVNMPWKAGSGMRKGKEQGIFFCAKAGERTYLRFVHADSTWQPLHNSGEMTPRIDDELGRCLRVIECSNEDEKVVDDAMRNAAYDLWELARKDIHERWMWETEPSNLHPKVRPLNIAVAGFIRENTPTGISQEVLDEALDILDSPWPRRDERQLREWFESDEPGGNNEKSKRLIEKIRASGLEPFVAPKPLPPISEEDIRLIVWMGITAG